MLSASFHEQWQPFLNMCQTAEYDFWEVKAKPCEMVWPTHSSQASECVTHCFQK